MPLHPSLLDICIRVAIALAAGFAVGFDRGERNEAAGLRTTILVCLAACFAGVLANLLLVTTGKNQHDFAQIDGLRLPLGVLSGIGFIGAGAIIKKDDIALGVTTAATMWFMTVIGLCLGTGAVVLGMAGSALALVVLWFLKWLEKAIPRAMRATLVIEGPDKFDQEAILGPLQAYRVVACSSRQDASGFSATLLLEWKGQIDDVSRVPPVAGLLG